MEKSDIQLSSEELKQVRTEFDRHPSVIAMRQKQATLRRTGHYIEALKMGRAIQELYSKVVSHLQQEEQSKVERVDIAKAQLPPDVRKSLMTLVITIYMACNIIESSVLDFNELLHDNLGPDYNLEMFQPLQTALKKAQEQLAFLNANSPYMKRSAWGDKCDNMYLMMRHKAEAVITDFLKHSKETKNK